LKRNSCKSFAK